MEPIKPVVRRKERRRTPKWEPRRGKTPPTFLLLFPLTPLCIWLWIITKKTATVIIRQYQCQGGQLPPPPWERHLGGKGFGTVEMTGRPDLKGLKASTHRAGGSWRFFIHGWMTEVCFVVSFSPSGNSICVMYSHERLDEMLQLYILSGGWGNMEVIRIIECTVVYTGRSEILIYLTPCVNRMWRQLNGLTHLNNLYLVWKNN